MKTNHILFSLVVNLLLLTGGAIPAFTQDREILRSGPGGMFVFLGENIPSGNPVASIRIERKSGSEDFKTIAETKFPSDFGSFSKENMKNHALLPHQLMPADEDLKSFYSEAARQSSLDSLKSFNFTIVERISAGNIYYDQGIKPGSGVSYRITQIDKTGRTIFQMTSVSSLSLSAVNMDVPVLAELHNNQKDIYLRWISVGNSPAKFFSVFRYERNVPVECTGTNARYLSHDTTTFIFTMPVDKEFSSSLHSFFIVPFDQYENPGGSSSIVIMDKGSLDRTFYKKAMAGKLSDRLGIKVSWKMSNPECIRRMEIYRSDAVDGKYELLATVGGSDTTFVDPNVIPDKNYFYHLKAIGTYPFQKKESHYFSAVAMDTRPPVTPAILSAIQVPNGVELKVRVNDAYIYGMRVYRNDGTGDELQPISDLVGAKDSTITYRDTSKVLNGYRNYVYKVRTESFSHVLSDYSNEAFVRPGIRTIPSPPGNFHGWIADGRARLFWDDGENQPDVILGYKVTRTEVNPQTGKAAGKEISITGNSLLRSNFYTDSAMVHGKTYTYAVYTIDRNHNASSSFATITLVLPEELPVPPAGLKAQTTDQGVVLKWGMAEFEKLSFYRIYRYQRGKDPEILKLAGKNETTYTDHSAIPGELYFYYLTSIDKADKESEPCDEVGITR